MFRSFTNTIETLHDLQVDARRNRMVLLVTGLALVGTIPLIAFLLAYTPFNGSAVALALVFAALGVASYEYRKFTLRVRRLGLEIRFLQFQDPDHLERTLFQKNTMWESSFLYQMFRQDHVMAGRTLDINQMYHERDNLFARTFATICPPWISLLPFVLVSLGWIVWQMPDRAPVLLTEGSLYYYSALAALGIGLLTEIAGLSARVRMYNRFDTVRLIVFQTLQAAYEKWFGTMAAPEMVRTLNQPIGTPQEAATKTRNPRESSRQPAHLSIPVPPPLPEVDHEAPTTDEPDTLAEYLPEPVRKKTLVPPPLPEEILSGTQQASEADLHWTSVLEELTSGTANDESLLPASREVHFFGKLTSVGNGQAALLMQPVRKSPPVVDPEEALDAAAWAIASDLPQFVSLDRLVANSAG